MTDESGILSLSCLSCEEQYAVDKFKETIIQQPDGKYVVQTMFKKDVVSLRNDNFLANTRYRSFMKSLYKYPERLKAYNEAMLKMLENEKIVVVNET